MDFSNECGQFFEITDNVERTFDGSVVDTISYLLIY